MGGGGPGTEGWEHTTIRTSASSMKPEDGILHIPAVIITIGAGMIPTAITGTNALSIPAPLQFFVLFVVKHG